MPVGYSGFPAIPPIRGFRLGTAAAGIKQPGRRDVVVMALEEGSTCAAVYTQNAFCAAPVLIAREHQGAAVPRFLLINTGNANAGTGRRGVEDARRCCEALAETVGCRPEEVLPFSTGVIGEPLPADRIVAALPQASAALAEGNWEAAAEGILTTDTVPKGAFRQVEIAGQTVTIGGISKGSGMIHPNMATMLAFVATDAAVDRTMLQSCLEQSVKHSFNRISVDGDTSTNDACVLAATGGSGIAIEAGSEAVERFQDALDAVCRELAQAIVRDGEGATKFVTIEVTEGRRVEECEQVAFAIAHSPLVKTALYASDPNWGRILATVGRAGLDGLDLGAVRIWLGDVCIVENGGRSDGYREEAGQAVMELPEVTIRVALGRGDAAAEVWTCDLSYDYVRINAEYRT